MRNLKDGIRSLVKIDFYGNVHKYFRGTDKEKRFTNEIRILKASNNVAVNMCPATSNPTRVSSTLLPATVALQLQISQRKKPRKSFVISKKNMVSATMIRFPRNITYDPNEGRFCVIDFELATLLDDPSKSEETISDPEP